MSLTFKPQIVVCVHFLSLFYCEIGSSEIYHGAMVNLITVHWQTPTLHRSAKGCDAAVMLTSGVASGSDG